MKIKILGAHMFESKTTKLSSILIDDVLAVDAGGLTSSLTLPEQEQIQYILLTHGHYDHIRDVPAFALKNQARTTDVFAAQSTLEILTTHLANGIVYPRFAEWPEPEKPALRLNALEAYKTTTIGQYEVVAIPVIHAVPAMGFQITDNEGKIIFISGDTGPGLAACWEYTSPQIMIIETALSNKSASIASKPGHLCPSLLGSELTDFRRIKGYLPPVILTHMNPEVENEITNEAQKLAEELDADISLAHEGMMIGI